MTRILVTGSAGAGKSTLSKEVAHKTGLPLFSLEKIVWKEHWQKVPREERKQKTQELIAQDDWVIDGVDNDVLAAADVVVFLDVPRRVCFYRVAKRNWRYLLSSRPDLPEHCPEILIIPKLIKIIWRFPSRMKPAILENKAQGKSTFIHLRHNQQREDYLKSL